MLFVELKVETNCTISAITTYTVRLTNSITEPARHKKLMGLHKLSYLAQLLMNEFKNLDYEKDNFRAVCFGSVRN
jgi:hypothetical protein